MAPRDQGKVGVAKRLTDSIAGGPPLQGLRFRNAANFEPTPVAWAALGRPFGPSPLAGEGIRGTKAGKGARRQRSKEVTYVSVLPHFKVLISSAPVVLWSRQATRE
jgi:hypothetical protein